MPIIDIVNPLLEEGIQKLNKVSNASYVQEKTITNALSEALPNSKAVVENSVQSFVSRVTGIKTSTGDVWCREFRGAIKNIGGTTTLVDTVISEDIAKDTATMAYVATFGIGTNDLEIRINTGDALEHKWKSETVFSEITF